jgi:hypothetical protein
MDLEKSPGIVHRHVIQLAVWVIAAFARKFMHSGRG